MKFTFEEAELINNCTEEETLNKDGFLERLNNIRTNTTDSLLVNILDSTINKIQTIDELKFGEIIKSTPLNNFIEY